MSDNEIVWKYEEIPFEEVRVGDVILDYGIITAINENMVFFENENHFTYVCFQGAHDGQYSSSANKDKYKRLIDDGEVFYNYVRALGELEESIDRLKKTKSFIHILTKKLHKKLDGRFGETDDNTT